MSYRFVPVLYFAVLLVFYVAGGLPLIGPLGIFFTTTVRSRPRHVVVDGNYVSTAGVTAGLDGSLRMASILRNDEVAQGIQLEIEYAPDPPFHSGTPDTAPPEVIRAFFAQYGHVKESREAEARRFATEFGIPGNR